MLIPTGFWSYTTSDEMGSRGKLAQLRALIAAELQMKVGRTPTVRIFQHVAAIPPGEERERQIREAIENSSFLIPIVTPNFLQSESCCQEILLFHEREKALGVDNLLFPIHYVDVEYLDEQDTDKCVDPTVLMLLRTRRWTDFRQFSSLSRSEIELSPTLHDLALGILEGLRYAAWVDEAEQRIRDAAVRLRAQSRRAPASAGLSLYEMLDLCCPAAETLEPTTLPKQSVALQQVRAAEKAYRELPPFALEHKSASTNAAPSRRNEDGQLDIPASLRRQIELPISPAAPVSSPAEHAAAAEREAVAYAPADSRAEYAPPYSMPSATRRRVSVTWLAAGAAIVGGLAFVFRHEIAAMVSALFTKVSVINTPNVSIDAMPPPKAIPTALDSVDISAFAPNGGAPGESVLVQVFLHMPQQAQIAMKRAREADPEVPRRGCSSLNVEVPRGQRLDVHLHGDDVVIDEPFQSLVWRGQPCASQFDVRLPRDAPICTISLRAQVLLDRVPIGSLKFSLRILAAAAAREPVGRRGDNAVRYRHAFLSYASADRAEVLKRAQALRAVGLSFFQDIVTLEPGDEWGRQLHEHIDKCDLFLLFWSKHSATSQWVQREIEHARARQLRTPHATPDITPIILEGPPVPMPIPNQLAHLHFNDYLLYGIAGSTPRTGEP